MLLCAILVSCSSDDKINEIEKQNKALIYTQIQEKKDRILGEKREIKKALLEEEEKEEKKLQEELLSDSLLIGTKELNKEALTLLRDTDEVIKFEQEYDLENDESLTKFVNNMHAFGDKKYIPQDLVFVEGEYIKSTKSGMLLRKEAFKALDDLAQNYYLQFKEGLTVISAYRSYEYQLGIKKGGCDDTFCAKAGYSEHQSGLAVDLWEVSDKNRFMNTKGLKQKFEWMNRHAHIYGFTNTYQKGVEVDGYAIEPWHWRFVGAPLAKILRDYNITLAEYYASPESY